MKAICTSFIVDESFGIHIHDEKSKFAFRHDIEGLLNMVCTKVKIRLVLFYESKRGQTATKAARNIR